MRWDFVIEFWTARLYDDTALSSVMGVRPWLFAGQAARPVKVPSIEYVMTGDREEEIFNPISVQVDFWVKGIKKAAQIERRIRLLTHSDVAQDLGGERMWLRYQDARTIDYPADPGVVHRAIDFEFTPLREKYVALT